jgi:hypothetical protein
MRKWSPEWLASATIKALLTAHDVARSNAMYVGETRGRAARSFFWSIRAEAVKNELDKRANGWYSQGVKDGKTFAEKI